MIGDLVLSVFSILGVAFMLWVVVALGLEIQRLQLNSLTLHRLKFA